jgi:DNA topoisomerase IB
VSPDGPGIRRRRSGRGFRYLDGDGSPVTATVRERIEALVIPPAWQDVWICPVPNGHIQAVGTDVAGRRQYLYHPAWREQRDRLKFDHVLTVGQRLPSARRQVTRHLALPGMPRERALALAFRLLDIGLFRIGGESYAEANGSYGLATLLRRHVTVTADRLTFRYAAKSGQRRQVEIVDPESVKAVRILLKRRARGAELLAYQDQDRGRWRDVTSSDINDYVKERLGDDVSAKDFRTWRATVLSAVELSTRLDEATSRTAEDRIIRATVMTIADYLGNTPAVARSSYIDPQVVELFRRGQVLEVSAAAEQVLAQPRLRNRAERALCDLLSDP